MEDKIFEDDELKKEREQKKKEQAEGLPVQEEVAVFALTKRDTVFAGCALAATLFLSLFGLFSGFSLGYLTASVLMFLLFAVYFARGAKWHVTPVICGVLSLANGAIFVCTGNGSVRFFGVIVGFLLSLVCFDGLVNGAAKGNRETFGIFYAAASSLGKARLAVKSLLTGDGNEKKNLGKALIGLLCAVPVIVVVVPLLISSDDAFRGMMNNIFGDTFEFFIKSVFGVLLFPFVIAYGFSLRTHRTAELKESRFAGLENTYIVSFLSAIGVFYVMYLFSQLAYFFSAFKGFLPNGEITYATYARKGFFEMCTIAVINLAIVFAALLLAKKENGKVCHGIKAVTTFICTFTLIIIATAISKMVLYIGAYGMTVLRLTTSAFMLFLSVVFISVILRIYVKRINIFKTALVAASCVILLLGVMNVNAVCAKYNYERYAVGGKTVDVSGMYKLGYEGVPYIVKLAESEDSVVANEAKQCLAEAYLYDYFNETEGESALTVDVLKAYRRDKDFERFSIPKEKAYESLYAYAESHPIEQLTEIT